MLWIGGGPRSTVGVTMEEEGVAAEVAHCVCVIFFSVPTIDRYHTYLWPGRMLLLAEY